jgi:DNA-binding NtrC family response regulator
MVRDSRSVSSRIVGSSYREPKRITELYAKQNYPVLFFGETGSGKELFAKHYMRSSSKSGKRLSANCAAFTRELLHSEVFGHVKGSFTGAQSNRDGLIRTCEDGILFLDELGEASSEFQTSILRVTEGNTFRPVGSDVEFSCTATIIAATNNLSRIRHDLKMRFNTIPIPPLQKIDMPSLAEHFLGKPLKDHVLKELSFREYLGNVRELKRCCESIFAERGEEIFGRDRNSLFEQHGTDFPLFDYSRFRREIETWNKTIQPIVDRYELHFKYRYFPLPNFAHWDNDRTRSFAMRTKTKSRAIPFPDLVFDSLKNLGQGLDKRFLGHDEPAEEVIPELASILQLIFETCSLPSFLEELGNRTGPPLPIVMPKPDLSPLFDMRYDEATSQFELAYLNHQIKMHGSRKKAAEVLGIKENTLISKLQRAKKALEE